MHHAAKQGVAKEILVRLKDLGADFYMQTSHLDGRRLPWQIARESGKLICEQSLRSLAATDASLNVPSKFVDPILGQLFRDPVLTSNGTVYERSCITEWLENHDTDPLTNSRLPDKTLIAMPQLLSGIESFRRDHNM